MIEEWQRIGSGAGWRAFQPDVMLPVQELRRRSATPEEALAAAVLEDAILCIRKYRRVGKGSGQRLYREAADWFLSEQQDWPFSFEKVCAYLKLDPDCVRRAVGVQSDTQDGQP